MASFLRRWYSTLSRISAQSLFANTLKQNRRLLEAIRPFPGHHTPPPLQQRAAGILFRWQHIDQPNVPGLQPQLQWMTTPDIQLAQRPFLFQTMTMYMLLQQIQRLFLSARKIQVLMMTTQLQCQLTALMTTLHHHPQHQPHRMLLLQLLVLVTLFEDGHKSMIRNSSVSMDARARHSWKAIGQRLHRDPDSCKARWYWLKSSRPELTAPAAETED